MPHYLSWDGRRGRCDSVKNVVYTWIYVCFRTESEVVFVNVSLMICVLRA